MQCLLPFFGLLAASEYLPQQSYISCLFVRPLSPSSLLYHFSVAPAASHFSTPLPLPRRLPPYSPRRNLHDVGVFSALVFRI